MRIDDLYDEEQIKLPGEPDTVVVTLESDDYRMMQFEVTEDWLDLHDLDEGDEWPEDLDEAEDEKYEQQNEWMENYLSAVSEMEKVRKGKEVWKESKEEEE